MTVRSNLWFLPVAIAFGMSPAAAISASFSAQILGQHNKERASIGVDPLLWDEQLAAAAAQWAKHLARTGQFDHAPPHPDAAPQGENLWQGTARAYSLEEMVNGWIDERQYFRPGVFPEVTTTQSWSDVGHYTQLVWHNTTHIGCAQATGGGNDILVCRYSPAGNWEGESPTGRKAPVLTASRAP